MGTDQVTPLLETHLPGLPLLARGKVRDIYDLGDRLLFVATDRISAFDVVLPTGIPQKGRVLTQLSAFWFERTRHLVPNHLITAEFAEFPAELRRFPELEGRAMLVRKARRIDVECVVRGYLAGSAWAEYQRSGTVHGRPLPPGLQEAQELDYPIFTPTTKAAAGHDRPLTDEELAGLVGRALAARLEEASLAVYRFAREHAARRGIIIADTKLEFGFIHGELAIIDELLTPDSSRFWDAATYRVGISPPSFDKQYVRDYLTAIGWNREPPAPELPPEVVARTTEKYLEAWRRLTSEA